VQGQCIFERIRYTVSAEYYTFHMFLIKIDEFSLYSYFVSWLFCLAEQDPGLLITGMEIIERVTGNRKILFTN